MILEQNFNAIEYFKTKSQYDEIHRRAIIAFSVFINEIKEELNKIEIQNGLTYLDYIRYNSLPNDFRPFGNLWQYYNDIVIEELPDGYLIRLPMQCDEYYDASDFIKREWLNKTPQEVARIIADDFIKTYVKKETNN